MDNFTDPLGIIPEDGLPPSNGWEIVLPGEESRRPSYLTRIASTSAEVTLPSEADFDSFLEILKESDDRLSAASDDVVVYDWQIVS
jgi:hypothetical protein